MFSFFKSWFSWVYDSSLFHLMKQAHWTGSCSKLFKTLRASATVLRRSITQHSLEVPGVSTNPASASGCLARRSLERFPFLSFVTALKSGANNANTFSTSKTKMLTKRNIKRSFEYDITTLHMFSVQSCLHLILSNLGHFQCRTVIKHPILAHLHPASLIISTASFIPL